MIFAKITPAAEVFVQTSPFNSEVHAANWMGAAARNYVLGQELTTFRVFFGEIYVPTQQEVEQGVSPLPTFINMWTTSMEFTAQQLSTWGSSDESALQIIAASINCTILEFVDLPNVSI